MNTEKLSNENETEALNKHVVMQAGSEKQPYFQLSTNEFGKHWLFYKPLESEPGKYSCWMPIDDEFYSEFNKLQKAALGSEAAVGQRSVGTNAEAVAFSCVSSDSLVYNRPCKEWCGNPYCKSEAPSGGHL